MDLATALLWGKTRSESAYVYPNVFLKNNYTSSIMAQIDYLGCSSDDYTLFPGQFTQIYRGLCEVTRITGRDVNTGLECTPYLQA